MARKTDLDQKITFRQSETLAGALGKIPKPKDVLKKMKVEGKNEIEVLSEKTPFGFNPEVLNDIQKDFENRHGYFSNKPKFNKIIDYTRSPKNRADFNEAMDKRKERLKSEGREEELEEEQPDEEKQQQENEEKNGENEEKDKNENDENKEENEKIEEESKEKGSEDSIENSKTDSETGTKESGFEPSGKAKELSEMGEKTGLRTSGAATGGAEGAGMATGAGGSLAAGETAAVTGGAAAAEGAAAGGGLAAAAIAALPEILLVLCVIGIILLIIIGAAMFFSGKSGNEPARAVENNNNFKIVASMTKKEELTKALDTSVDDFIKQIQTIKDGASGDNKTKITEFCDKILEKTNLLKEVLEKIKNPPSDATPEDKEEYIKQKEKHRVEIIDLVDKLLPLIQNIINIAMQEIGVCRGTREFSTKRFNNGSAWCAAFVRYVYGKTGITLPNTDLAPNLYCEMQKNPDKYITFEAGQGTPQPEDIVFFGWGSIDESYCNAEIEHVGLVKEVISASEIKTIEGNTSGDTGSSCVAEKTRNIQTSYGGSGARFFARVK